MDRFVNSSPVTDIEDGWTRRGRVSLDSQDPARNAMFTWLEQHGIDPAEVVASPGVERDADAGVVRYSTFVRDPDGRRRIDPSNDKETLRARVEKTCDPLLPFPETITFGVPTKPADERPPIAEVVRTDAGWHARLRASNGEVLVTSEVYDRRETAQRCLALLGWTDAEDVDAR